MRTSPRKLIERPLFQNGSAQLLQGVVMLMLTREIIRVMGSTEYGALSFSLLILSLGSILDAIRNLLTKLVHDFEVDGRPTAPLFRSMERWNMAAAFCSFLLVLFVQRIVGQRVDHLSQLLIAVATGSLVAQSPYCAALYARNQTGAVSLIRALYWWCLYMTVFLLAFSGRGLRIMSVAICILTLGLTGVYRALGYKEVSIAGPGEAGGFRLFLGLFGGGMTFSLLGAVLGFADRVFLNKFGDPAQFGRYAVIYDLGSKVALLGSLVAIGVYPVLSRCFSEGRMKDFRRLYLRNTVIVGAFLASILLASCLMTPKILTFWAPRVAWTARDGWTFRLVIAAAVCQGLGAVVGYALLASRMIKWVIWSYVISVVLTLSTAPFLVLRLGGLGAATVYLTARSVDLIMFAFLAIRVLSSRGGDSPDSLPGSNPAIV